MRVQTTLLAASFTAGLVISASAADLPVKAPRFAPPVAYSWSGFYIGGYAGAAWARSEFGFAATGAWGGFPIDVAYLNSVGSRRLSDSGFTGGGQIGFNWQSGNLVLGAEADFGFLGLSDRFDQLLIFPPGAASASGGHIVSRFDTNWLFTLRGRIGWANDRVLYYATGGLAVTDLDVNVTVVGVPATNLAIFDSSKKRAGWTVGGGVEWAFAGNWSAKLEYLYIDFGEISGVSAFNNSPTFTHSHTVDLTVHTVRFGLNYKFGPSASY